MTDRKLLAKVSCGIVTQWSHDGQETVCEGFPTGMSRIGPLPDRKLSAKVSCGIVTQWSHDGQETVGKGFLWDCYAMVLCRTGNCLRRVSYWHVTHWSFAGQETVCEAFPTGMLRSSPMMDRKPVNKKRTPTKGVLLEWQKIILQS